jgi:hypothetical protein
LHEPLVFCRAFRATLCALEKVLVMADAKRLARSAPTKPVKAGDGTSGR